MRKEIDVGDVSDLGDFAAADEADAKDGLGHGCEEFGC